MGVHIFSEWHSQLDQGGSGFCHYFLSDVILEDLETVRRKAVIFLHGLKHRYTPTDSPLTVKPTLTLDAPKGDFFHTGEFSFEYELKQRFPDLGKAWEDSQFFILSESDSRAKDIRELMEAHGIVFETSHDQFVLIGDVKQNNIYIFGHDYDYRGELNLNVGLTEEICKKYGIPFLYYAKFNPSTEEYYHD
jgi:hypothetical protein